MVAIKDNSPRFTPEEYFAWEEQQLERHELIDGEVYAMTGGTVNHSQIAVKFISLLDNHLSGSWEIINYQAGDMIELKSVNLTFPIEQIYEDITLTQAT